MWEPEAPEASAGATAVPLRRVIGPSPTSGRWGKLALSAIAGMGWVVAGALVFGGGYMLWHLLFGDSVGGDVWLGKPPAWVEQQAAGSDDDIPGGVPWSPDMIDRSTTVPGGTVPLTVVVDGTSTTVTTVPPAATVTTTTVVAQAPLVQSPAGGAAPTTVRPATPVTTVRPTSTTVATTTATTTATTVPHTVTSTTVANTVTSTTIDDTVPSTTVSEPTTTDVTSTTVDDGDSSGRGRGGSGGGGD